MVYVEENMFDMSEMKWLLTGSLRGSEKAQRL